jgi:phosphoribosylformylglycinamidine (FGAM) synthase PurS component
MKTQLNRNLESENEQLMKNDIKNMCKGKLGNPMVELHYVC